MPRKTTKAEVDAMRMMREVPEHNIYDASGP
jgi:hypothetical protein